MQPKSVQCVPVKAGTHREREREKGGHYIVSVRRGLLGREHKSSLSDNNGDQGGSFWSSRNIPCIDFEVDQGMLVAARHLKVAIFLHCSDSICRESDLRVIIKCTKSRPDKRSLIHKYSGVKQWHTLTLKKWDKFIFWFQRTGVLRVLLIYLVSRRII